MLSVYFLGIKPLSNQIFEIQIKINADRLSVYFDSKKSKPITDAQRYIHFIKVSKRLSVYLIANQRIFQSFETLKLEEYLSNANGQTIPYSVEISLDNLKNKTQPKLIHSIGKSSADFFYENEISFNIDFDEPEIEFF